MATSMPMTRLGGRAFAHGSGDDVEAEYDRLRGLARAEAAKRSSCFDRAHQAYERGDGAGAKALSSEGKRHAAQMDEYNRRASEYIFRENNAPGRVAEDTVDLHGQFVEEAGDILEARLRDARARGQTHLHVIVGKGNHSADHVQRVRPRVEQVCRELGLHYATEENEGRIYVDLSGGQVGAAPPLPPQPGAGYGGAGAGAGYGYGYGYGGGQQQQQQQQQQYHQQQQQHHYQQQQHQQQQQQQQQQPDEIEQMVNKLLPRIFRKLEKACCVVM